MTLKPAHLAPKYAAQFADKSVVAVYRTRPPYPESLFDILESLVPDSACTLLDLGCGTGEIAIPMSRRLGRVVAIDPSMAMLEAAKFNARSEAGDIQWINISAEEFAYPETYGLVVAAASLHWMEWSTVLPRITSALAPAGFLVLVNLKAFSDAPWSEELRGVVAEYSTNRDYQTFDLINELTDRRTFSVVGSEKTSPLPFSQTVDDYIESFHARNGLSRQRMPGNSAALFDDMVRGMVRPYVTDGLLHTNVEATITWGRPQVVR